MNTVGKPGKLGENVKCVVSVSMLTEGWDANTVTHILGVRAFGTQLLCEQVVGRGLRRMSYHAEPVPSHAGRNGRSSRRSPSNTPRSTACRSRSFPCRRFDGRSEAGPDADPRPGMEDRASPARSPFPRIDGYRYELPAERLTAKFTKQSKLALTTADVPTKVENAPIVGESVHSHAGRPQGETPAGGRVPARQAAAGALLPRRPAEHQALAVPRPAGHHPRWLDECVVCKDNTFPQLLLLVENAYDAADRIYKAIVAADDGEKRLLPIPKPYDTVGSHASRGLRHHPGHLQDASRKCHVSHVVADTESWEQKMAQTLEDMDEVLCYVKNHNLGFLIPYTIGGEQRNYMPDFIVRIDDGHGRKTR